MSARPQSAPALSPPRSALPVYTALVLVQLLFGANFVAAKLALREVPTLGLVAIRSWGAASVLAAALPFRRRNADRPRFTMRDYGEILAFGLLGIPINQLAFLEGLTHSTATNASIILVMIPMLTLAIAVMLRRERATLLGTAGILMGFTGALIMIVPRGGATLSHDALLGNLLLLACSVAYSGFLVLARPLFTRHDALTVMTVMFVVGGISLTPTGFAGMRDVALHGLTPVGWWSVIFVTVGATALPYLITSWALGRAKSSIVAVFVLLQPIVAAVTGRIFLGERLGANAAVAAVLIVAGVLATAWTRATAGRVAR